MTTPKEWAEKLQADRDAPANRALDKLRDFVNRCVTDPDFLHSDSRELLRFLIVCRDHLTESYQPGQTLDDILQPVVGQLARSAGAAKQSRLEEIKAEIQREWIARGCPKGERQRFADEMSARYGGSPTAGTIRKEYISGKALKNSRH